MKKNLSYQDGFSLVELAIVLTIIGLIAGFSVPMLTESLHHKKWQKGEQHLEEVMTALAAYVGRHHRLPCAADPNAQGAERGLARAGCKKSSLSIGLVPYRTLGLPENIAEDGYKRPFTYCVNTLFTSEQSLDLFCGIPEEQLFVLDAQHQKLHQESDNPVVFVLVSYGEKGEGAYTKEGGRVPARSSLSLPERTNGEPSTTFYDLPYSRAEEAPFRQQVKWITRDQLLLYYLKRPCVKSTITAPETPAKLSKTPSSFDFSQSEVNKKHFLSLTNPILNPLAFEPESR